jgi:phosphatidylserine synthase
MHKQRIILLIACGLGVLAAFFTWERTDVYYSGFQLGHGWVSFILFALAALVSALFGEKSKALANLARKLVLILGSIVSLFMVFELLYIGLKFSSFGLYLSLFCAGIVMVLPVMVKADGTVVLPTRANIKDVMK